MKGGYEALIWINDADGKQYVCALENIGNKKSFDDLTDEEINMVRKLDKNIEID